LGYFAKTLLLAIFWVAFVVPVFVHVFYPVVLAVLSRAFRGRSGARERSVRGASVLLWDDDLDRAKRTLDSLLDSDLPKDAEIVLLGAASKLLSDDSSEFIRSFAETEAMDRASALSFAALKSGGDVLVLLFIGVKLDRLSIKESVRCLDSTDSGCAFAVPGSRPCAFHYSEGLAGLLESSGVSNLSVWPGLLAVRRELVRPFGPGDVPEFAVAFDVVASGHRVASCTLANAGLPESREFAGSVSEQSRTMLGEARTLFARTGLLNPFSFGLLSVRIWIEKVLFWLTPLFVFTAFFANFVVAFFLWKTFYLFLMSIQSVFYLVALVGYHRWTEGRGGPSVAVFGFVRSSLAMALMWQRYSKR